MRIAATISFFVLMQFTADAQSRVGITGQPDTSYQVSKEWEKARKQYPGIQRVELAKTPKVKVLRNLVYQQLPSRALRLDVFTPVEKKQGQRIAILFIHGGGWRSGNREMHQPLAQRLALRGYVCFTPEYRLSTEALYPAAVHDLKAAVAWVRAHAVTYNIHPDRIVVAGHSAGGELAAMVGATNGKKQFEGDGFPKNGSSIANAVIDIDGTLAFLHPESGEGDDSRGRSAATYWFGYGKEENPELWKEAAPLTQAGAHCPPYLFIGSSVKRMQAARTDFVQILLENNTYSEITDFNGAPHSFVLFAPWQDSILVTMDRFLQRVFRQRPVQQVKVIAADGSGSFKTITEAFQSIPIPNSKPVTFLLKKGVYREKVQLDSLKDNVRLIGEDKMNTIIVFNDHSGKISPAGDTIRTQTSYTFRSKANGFYAENISFSNEAGFSAGQAVAVESNGDKAVFRNCRFLGFQDVLFTNNENSRQYFENCTISGTTDFIFGSATVWFEQCHIYSKKNSHVTAASTPKEKIFGYVFNRCRLTGDDTLRNVSMGRPWRPFASVLYMNSYLGPHIKAEGWSNWNNTENDKTTRFSEYNNYGPSASFAGRLGWIKLLSETEARAVTLANVFPGWNPLQ